MPSDCSEILLWNLYSFHNTNALWPDIGEGGGLEGMTLSPSICLISALGKWGRTQMGSDGFNRILSGFYLLDPARVRPVHSETRDLKGFRPDFNWILTGL